MPAVDKITKEAAQDELIAMIIRGATRDECAKMLGFHPNTITNWTNEPEFKLKLARTRALIFSKSNNVIEERANEALKSVEQMIEEALPKALSKMIEKLESGNEHIVLKAASDILDRSSKTAKNKKTQAQITTLTITPEQLALAARTAKEINENIELGIDVKPLALTPIDVSSIEATDE